MQMDDTQNNKLITISKDATAKEAAAVMMKYHIGCLIVNDSDEKFAGVVSERDIVNRTVAASRSIEDTTVAEIMTTQIITCSRETATSEARKMMATNRIRHLPIVGKRTGRRNAIRA